MAILLKGALQQIIKSTNKEEAVKVESVMSNDKRPDWLSFGGYNSKKYQPDAVVRYKGYADMYSIENKLSKKVTSDHLQKWILFSLEARKMGGMLYLIIDDILGQEVVDVLAQKKIRAEVIPVVPEKRAAAAAAAAKKAKKQQ
jgi:hypothetical protein